MKWIALGMTVGQGAYTTAAMFAGKGRYPDALLVVILLLLTAVLFEIDSLQQKD